MLISVSYTGQIIRHDQIRMGGVGVEGYWGWRDRDRDKDVYQILRHNDRTDEKIFTAQYSLYRTLACSFFDTSKVMLPTCFATSMSIPEGLV